jgi:hypothetical protein
VWFSEPENQSIFRKTYLQGLHEDQQLLPQYVLIYGRASEFEVSGPHERPDRLKKKRDFMRREHEHFMTFDSLRPKRDFSDFATLTMTANGPVLYAVPPSFTTGRPTMEIARRVRHNPRMAIDKTELWDDARKAHVMKRWLHWQQVADRPHEIDFHTMEMGE